MTASYPKEGNLRQKPVVYVNSQPVCARPPNRIGEYAEYGKEQEVAFLKTC